MFLLFIASSLSAPVRIWCLGDSITGSPGCWRALLWRKLQTDGYTNTDFVGSLSGQDCSFTFDSEHDGHGGYLITDVQKGLYKNNDGPIDKWLTIANPDIALIHFGTNDAWNGIAAATICDAYTWVLNKIRGKNPAAYILMAQIIPLAPTQFNCPECPQRVVTLNAAIAQWAQGHSTATSPIVLVDQWTGFDTKTDTREGVHPNDAGNEKIATKWLKPLETAITAKGGH
jgi:lysophospholipase L1-like esterase